MTPPESDTIIASLFALVAREKRSALHVVGIQVAVALIVTGIAYSMNGSFPFAIAMFGGGMVSVFNGALLAWRMSKSAFHSAHEAHHPDGAHRQLRLLYYYAAERFMVVVALLGLCLAVLRLSPLAVLCGFAAGQAALLVARLLLNRYKYQTEIVTK